jgi:hypothetical protein
MKFIRRAAMTEIICTNGVFPADALEFYKAHGVSVPKEGEIYSIRDVMKFTAKPGEAGAVGFHLHEIKNPKVPVKHPILGDVQMEPSWHQSRFAKLDGSILTLADINQITVDLIRHIDPSKISKP